MYSKLLKEQMDKASLEQKKSVDTPQPPASKPQSKVIPKGSIPKFDTSSKSLSRKPRSSTGGSKGKKRGHVEVEVDANEDLAKRMKVDVEPEADVEEDSQTFTQPALITGAKLKKYQLEGVAWMAGLYQNGISGILGMLFFALVLHVTHSSDF